MSEYSIPLEGKHILQALEQGREDQELLRKSEMEWLGKNNPFVAGVVQRVFAVQVKISGIIAAEATMAGSMLGHRSIRYCAADAESPTEVYRIGSANYGTNVRTLPSAVNTIPLTEEGPLTQVFGETDVVRAIMEIRHPRARDAVAAMTSFFCFDHVPDLTPLSLPSPSTPPE
jgi:hypothetical protein